MQRDASARKPAVQFASARDGAQIAFVANGYGPPVVRAGAWFTHARSDPDNPVWGPYLEELGRGRRVIRYDPRGCGLSGLGNEAPTNGNGLAHILNVLVDDLLAVVDTAGVERFALWGPCGGAAVAVAFAAKYPERVSRLLVQGCGAWDPNAPQELEDKPTTRDTIADIVRLSLEIGSPFPHLRAVLSLPDATPEVLAWLNGLKSLSVVNVKGAAALLEALWKADVSQAARQVRCPTIVLHSLRDQFRPFEEGRKLADWIPGARLLPLDSRNHLVLQDEPAWGQWVAVIREFFPADGPVEGMLTRLTPREAEVFRLLAEGSDNLQIAASLSLSEKTVRNMVSHIYAKLAVENRGQAIVLAQKLGYNHA